jgi:hypothetical protein
VPYLVGLGTKLLAGRNLLYFCIFGKTKLKHQNLKVKRFVFQLSQPLPRDKAGENNIDRKQI